MPIEAIVIPIWQAESDSSILSSCSTTASAPLSPSSASCSILPRRLRTSANSAATKKPLIATSSSRRTSSRTLIGYVARYFGGGRRRPFGVGNIAFRSADPAISAILIADADRKPRPVRDRDALRARARRQRRRGHPRVRLPARGAFPAPPDPRPCCPPGLSAGEIDRAVKARVGRGPGAVRARRGAAGRARARPDRHPGGLRRLRGLLRGRGRGRRAAAEQARGSCSRTRARSARCSRT